jgi:CubicO group peptidase (beta-lactamase class C family)
VARERKRRECLSNAYALAAAILDRLRHHSITVNIEGQSCRLRETLKAGLLKPKLGADRGNDAEASPGRRRSSTPGGGDPNDLAGEIRMMRETYDAAIREGRVAAQDVLKDGRASALTIALVARREVIWSQAFGLADREAGKAATVQTMFGTGSVSKLFATIAALKLVDKGLGRP